EELLAVAPRGVGRVGERDPFGVASVPGVLGGLHLLPRGLLGERRDRGADLRGAHPRNGSRRDRVGRGTGDGTLRPAARRLRRFWLYYKVICPDTLTYDWAPATLTDNTANGTVTILPKTRSNSGVWTHVTTALTAGHSYTLTLTSHDDDYPGDATYTRF